MTATDPQFVPIGEVVKPIGLKGELKLYPLLDFHGPLLDGPHLVWDDGSPAGIVSYRPSGNCVAIWVDGVSGRNEAEAAVGRVLGFRRDSYLEPDFEKPGDGLPFRFLGRPVETVAGERIGTVAEVRWTGGQILLVLESGGGQILIPAVAPILAPDDKISGPLTVDPPEGLLDVQG